METQPEITVAAEAVRTWVRGQRASWSSPVASSAAAAALLDPAPVAPRAPRAPQPPIVPPMPGPVVARSEQRPVAPPVPPPPPKPAPASAPAPAPVPVMAPPPSPAPVLKAPPVSTPPAIVVDSPAPRAALADVDADETTPFWKRGSVRIVLAIAAVIVVAAGALLMPGMGRSPAAPRTGTAAFDSTPSGAQVLVDGSPVGDTPVRVELPVGEHAVEFRLKSATRSQKIQVARGAQTALAIDWNAKRTGTLQVTSTPDSAKVLVDGRERGVTPLTLNDLAVGSHTVQLETSEGSIRRKVEITEGRTEPLAESIYPGWLHVSAPIDVAVLDGTAGLQLDDTNRVLLKPGVHTIRVENRALGFSVTRQVTIEPGATASVDVSPEPSTLTVTGTPGAEVFIDGTKAGEIPLADYKVKLGMHDVMVVDRSGATRHSSVRITTQPAQLDVTFTRP